VEFDWGEKELRRVAGDDWEEGGRMGGGFVKMETEDFLIDVTESQGPTALPLKYSSSAEDLPNPFEIIGLAPRLSI
jgi:hypothetical protein